MKKLIALVAVLALVIAACGSDEADETTTTTVAAGGDTTTTAADTTTTTAADTTTTTAADTTTTVGDASSGDSALAECVVGTWELDSRDFFERLLEALPPEEQIGEFEIVDGAYVLTVNGDGTFSNERVDWTFAVTSDFGDLQVRISSEQTGTYTIEGDQLTTRTDPGDPPEVEFLVDGSPFEFPGGVQPIAPPEAEFSGATVSCSGDTLTASADDFTSTWMRIG